ncbi:MAG TPA: tRNA lysidine(34) synthetase TilS [Planctomycetota bacterium]|nr:tRNA lysidine(34) synthetase TilS [Planctomycetota bacterium]
MDAALEAEVAARAVRDGLLRPGDAVLVAASGGADSTALAGLLARGAEHGLPLRLVLGHVDHGWRGRAEAEADRAVVTRLAALLGVPLACAGPPEPVRRTEDDARRFRYRALADLATAHGCALVATGHHLRDQAETFLLRLVRGSGPAGLAGIPARRPLAGGPLAVVRPVLWVDPARLRAWAIARGLPWREDPTNAEVDRDRARVRARLAALDARGAALTRDVAEAAARFARSVARREAVVAARLSPSRAVHTEAGAVEVLATDVAALPPSETATVLRLLGRGLAADAEGPWFTRRHATIADELIHGVATHAAVDLPRGLLLARSGRRLLLARKDVAVPPTARLDVVDGASATAGPFRVRVRRTPAAGFDAEAWRATHGTPPTGVERWAAALDARVLGRFVTLRGVEPGDRFVPWGRTEETALEEFLSRQSWPALLRRGVRVAVAEDGRVAWVLGHRIDAHFAVTPATLEIARLDAEIERTGGSSRAGDRSP